LWHVMKTNYRVLSNGVLVSFPMSVIVLHVHFE
jgi:hypothetical protein